MNSLKGEVCRCKSSEKSSEMVLVMIYFQLCYINLSQTQINSHIIGQ